MSEQQKISAELTPEQITSRVYIIAPTQIDFIADRFGNMVADRINMRAFAPKIRAVAREALTSALESARKMGAN